MKSAPPHRRPDGTYPPLAGNDPLLDAAPATLRDRLNAMEARVRDLGDERAELVK